MSTIRVLLADDHALVRAGIRILLQMIPGVEVVAEAEDATQALRLVESLRPDIAFVDVSMPGPTGIDAAEEITARYPRTRVLILSMHATEDYVSRALRSGAKGYILKDATPMELELAIKSVMRDETYLSPRVSSVVVDKLLRGNGQQPGPLDLITLRQRQILKLIAEGKSTKQIAAQLDVSIKTVETHRALLMERLGIRDLAGLVRFAVRVGLVPGDL